MIRRRKALVFFVVLCLCSLLSSGEVLAYTAEKHFEKHLRPYSERIFMTGEWDGKRNTLADKGVTFASTYVFDVLGNAFGGIQRAVRYDSSMGWDVNFDLEKFVGMKGTQFHISGLWRQGQNLSKVAVGNDFTVSSIYGREQFRFYGLYLQKMFFEDRLDIRLGRMAAGDDFAHSSLYWNFVSNAPDGNPIALPLNFFFSCYPNAVWGSRAKFALTKDIQLMAGIYNGDPGVPRDSMYGLDWSLRLKEGIMGAFHLSYNPNTAPEATGMPGHYKAEFYYHGGTFRDYYSDINGASQAVTDLDSKKHIGNPAVYLHADQMIYREKGPGTDEGLTPLIVVTLQPENINKFPFFMVAGLLYKGLIPGRDDDMTMFQMSYGTYSGDLHQSEADAGDQYLQSYECVFEWSYKLYITPWWFVQPDIQYIKNPGGTNRYKDAMVFGSRLGLTF